jgi:hypothetical protein
MSEVLEGVEFPALEKELKAECPFKEKPPGKNPSKQPEGPEEVQENDGGILGKNLEAASEGDADTINEFYRCEGLQKEPREDTSTKGTLVHVTDQKANYPYVQAAHHCIPGVAALENSDLYKTYMNEGDKVQTKKATYEIAVNIGYCVNGAHNGVWLPGNYAIREDNPANPKKKNWGDIADPDFKMLYTAAVMRKCDGKQFHDAHPTYNSKVKGTLNKICQALVVHQDNCEECKGKNGKKIPPPYKIKLRLYKLSGWLKGILIGPMQGWKDPYFASSKVRRWFLDPVAKKQFEKAYKDASP